MRIAGCGGFCDSLGMTRFAILLPLLLGGCVVGTIAHTAVDVVTLPVKVASAGIDAATTSQAEADRNRGRALRKADERCRKGRPLATDDCGTAVPR
jgi:hypothetical protein